MGKYNKVNNKIIKPNYTCQTLPSNLPKNKLTIIAKGDSGASQHYIRLQDQHCLKNLEPNSSVKVTLPDSQAITSTTQGQLPFDNNLSSKAKTAIILPKLKSSLLISLGQLCDNDCHIHLNKEEMKVYKKEDLIMKGVRNKRDGLWDIPIQNKNCNHSASPIAYTMKDHKFLSAIKPNSLDAIIKEYTKEDNALNVIIKKKQTHK